ncbi:MAG: hypothetical protein AUK64_2126 [bacterium P201]|nr:MAG: hypothetical protein AUK64_2126 [bacterium P201]
MGNGADFFSRDERGRRSEYVSLEPARIVNGVKGHLIKKAGDSDTHTNLPYYSNTSDVYFRQNKNGVCQARVYVGQKKYLDFDWSHIHTNSDGRKFDRGTVHVQVWKQNKDGSFSRISDNARSMSNAEMKKYGPILKDFCPSVKLRKGR